MRDVLIGLCVLSAALALVLALNLRARLRTHIQVLVLENTIRALKRDVVTYQTMAYELAAQRDAALLAPLRLDAQTVGLIRLATSNPERHEAACSALIVCERLSKRLG